jgi:hypothetical protein
MLCLLSSQQGVFQALVLYLAVQEELRSSQGWFASQPSICTEVPVHNATLRYI